MFYFLCRWKTPRAMPAELADVWAWEEDAAAAAARAPPPAAASARAAAPDAAPPDEEPGPAAAPPDEELGPAAVARVLALLEELEEAQRRALQTTSAGLVALMVLLTVLLLHVERGNARLRRMEELARLPPP